MSEANERERIILRLLDTLTYLGFDLEDCVFEWSVSEERWIVSDASHARVFTEARNEERESQ